MKKRKQRKQKVMLNGEEVAALRKAFDILMDLRCLDENEFDYDEVLLYHLTKDLAFFMNKHTVDFD